MDVAIEYKKTMISMEEDINIRAIKHQEVPTKKIVILFINVGHPNLCMALWNMCEVWHNMVQHYLNVKVILTVAPGWEIPFKYNTMWCHTFSVYYLNVKVILNSA